MLTFAKKHWRALCAIFLAALATYLAVRGVQWAKVGSLIAPFTLVQLVITMPGAWLIGAAVDPLLWKLPLSLNLVLFEVLIAAGFAINVVILALVLWHRKAVGRWWGGDDASGVIRKTA